LKYLGPETWWAGKPASFKICRVGIVVKNTISNSGSSPLIRLAKANIRVKWPKPTPLVGNITTVFVIADSKFGSVGTVEAGSLPSISRPILSIMNGRVTSRKGARHGFLMASVMWMPKRNDGDDLKRFNSRSSRAVLEPDSSLTSIPLQQSIRVVLLLNLHHHLQALSKMLLSTYQPIQ